jgi:hypothetical protein
MLRRRLDRGRLTTAAIVALLSVPPAVYLAGGANSLFLARADAVELRQITAGGAGQANYLLLGTALNVPSFVVFAMLLGLWVHDRRHGRSVPVAIKALALFAGAVALAINNPIASPRYWFGTVLMTPLLIMWPRGRRGGVGLYVVLLGAVLLAVLPFADLFRRSLDVHLRDNIAAGVVNTLATKVDYDAFQQTLNAVEFTEAEGIAFGRQLIGAALFWVPRSFWANKPIASGEIVGLHHGYATTNLSMPLWAEFFIDGGVVMVFAGFCIYSITLNAIERPTLRGSLDSAVLHPVVLAILAVYQLYFLRGSLMIAVAYLVPVLGCLFLCSAPASATRRARCYQRERSWQRGDTRTPRV